MHKAREHTQQEIQQYHKIVHAAILDGYLKYRASVWYGTFAQQELFFSVVREAYQEHLVHPWEDNKIMLTIRAWYATKSEEERQAILERTTVEELRARVKAHEDGIAKRARPKANKKLKITTVDL